MKAAKKNQKEAVETGRAVTFKPVKDDSRPRGRSVSGQRIG